MAQRNGTGVFPREVMNRFPLLPLEEEGRLNDMPLRESCIECVFGQRRKPGHLRIVAARVDYGTSNSQCY
jgi:hypothetical protein